METTKIQWTDATWNPTTITAKRRDAAGINAFLQKPLTPDELSQMVRDVLDQAKDSARGNH